MSRWFVRAAVSAIVGVPPAITGMIPGARWWLTTAAAGAALFVMVATLSRMHAELSRRLSRFWVDVKARRSEVLGAIAISFVVLVVSTLAGLIVTQWWRRPAQTAVSMMPPQVGL